MRQFYFEHSDSEICYEADYFYDIMSYEGLDKIEVYRAEPETWKGIFWCTMHAFCGDDTRDTCGKQCKQYEPRNGRSGACKYHRHQLYTHGEKTILTPKNK